MDALCDLVGDYPRMASIANLWRMRELGWLARGTSLMARTTGVCYESAARIECADHGQFDRSVAETDYPLPELGCCPESILFRSSTSTLTTWSLIHLKGGNSSS